MRERHAITLEIDAEVHAWLEETAAREGKSAAALAAEIVVEERTKQAQQAMEKWLREEEMAPSTEDIDHLRDSLLGLEDVVKKP